MGTGHYDALGQLTQLQNLTPDGQPDNNAPGAYWVTDPITGGQHTILSKFSNITYDAQGNRTGMDIVAETLTGFGSNPSTFASGAATFSYDNGGRLTGESWSGGFGATVSYTHTYDAADNLTSLRGSSWTFDALTDQLTGSTNNSAYATVTFDPTGEETAANGLQYNYHLAGGQAVASGTTVDTAVTGVQRGLYQSSGYDAGGWRDYKSVVLDGSNIHDETYLYDGDALVFRWTTWPQDAIDSNTDLTVSNGDPTVMYLWGPTGPIMEFDLLGNSRTFTFDPNGSCVATSNGTVSRPTFYDGYGKQVWTYTYPNNKHALRQPFQYKGQFGYYTDVHTGLCYCQHRYYDPITGRWLSRDPIGLDGGVNVYGYCGGNPVMSADPSGLQDEWTRQFNNYFGGRPDPVELKKGAVDFGRRVSEQYILPLRDFADFLSFLDPTPTCDGVSALLSLLGGDHSAAALSGIGMLLPCVNGIEVKVGVKVGTEVLRGLWKFDTKLAEKTLVHPQHGAFHLYKGFWWTVDHAGHGGSKWKVYEKHGNELVHYSDVDQFGDFMRKKWKGPIGKRIPLKEFHGR